MTPSWSQDFLDSGLYAVEFSETGLQEEQKVWGGRTTHSCRPSVPGSYLNKYVVIGV